MKRMHGMLALLFAAAAWASTADAQSVSVSGIYRYQDTNGAMIPIRNAEVEVWKREWTGIWQKYAARTTDSTGFFFVGPLGFSNGDTVAVRVYAANFAAHVKPGGVGTWWRESQQTVSSPGLDFSTDFTSSSDLEAARRFNVADTLRQGFLYATVRRDPRQSDAIPQVGVIAPEPDTHYLFQISLEADDFTGGNDLVVLHEYGHALEDSIGAIGVLGFGDHTVCGVHDGLLWMSGAQHAWQEAFPTYFAHAVAASLPAPPAHIGGPGFNPEFPTCPAAGSLVGDRVEAAIFASLWDLFDPANETHDLVVGRDRDIFQVFDHELDNDTKLWVPTIHDVRNALLNRGLNRNDLDRILARHEIVPHFQAAQFVSQSAPTSLNPGQTVLASVTMRNTGSTVWTFTGNHRLGSQNPQDNTTWGTHRAFVSSAVLPGTEVTLFLNMTAPTTPGLYNFRWRMLQEMVEWFGDYTPNLVVQVGNPAPPPAPDPEPCPPKPRVCE